MVVNRTVLLNHNIAPLQCSGLHCLNICLAFGLKGFFKVLVQIIKSVSMSTSLSPLHLQNNQIEVDIVIFTH